MKRSICASLLLVSIVAGSACAQNISSVKSNAVVGGTNTFYPYDTINYFTVTGRVTSPFLSFTNETVIFIQDTSSGIRVESIPGFLLETNSTVFAPGVQVTVYGRIGQADGMRMIRPEIYDGNPYDSGCDFYISGTTTSPVAPAATTIANFLTLGEDFEGGLIRINGLKMGTNAWAYQANSSLTITDSTGTITLYIDKNTDVDGQLPPTNTFDLVGLASQYSTLPIPSNGYEIVPRSYADFIQTVGEEPPSILAPTSVIAIVGQPLSAWIVGRDRNASNTLSIRTNSAPAGSAFVPRMNREWTLAWTPAIGSLNTTNSVVFNISDAITAVTGTTRVIVRSASGGPGFAWINEFHYDMDGADTNDFVELAGETGIDLGNYYLLFYNGNDGKVYRSNTCSGVIGDEGNGYGALWFPISEIQNGPDGIALCHRTNGCLQFISYEDSFTASNGPASGWPSVDVGVRESGDEPPGLSLQLQGEGTNYEAFTWTGPMTATPGEINGAGQVIVGPAHAKITYANLTLIPDAPSTSTAFDIVCTITPNYSADSLVATAWVRVGGGMWSNKSMTDQGGYYFKTDSQISRQTNGTLVEYYVSTTFGGPGTNSPTVTATNSYLIQNLPPAFAALSNRIVTVSNSLTFAVSATDAELDPISLSVSNAPAGSTFTSTNGNGNFYWTNAAPVGVYTTKFYAADGGGQSSTAVTIRVSAVVLPVLVYYDFDLGTASFTNIAASVSTQLVASICTTDVGRASGVAGNPGQAISSTAWNGPNHYFKFTLTISNGYQISVTALTFDDQRSGTGPTNWFIRSSADNYASILGAGLAHTDIASSSNVVLLGLSGLTNSVTFRIHATNTASSAGTWRLDNVTLQGTVTQIGGLQDGIPVSWWQRYGLGPTNTANGNNDSDPDSNYEEYVADTDPTNNASYFVYEVTNMTGRGELQLLVGPPTTNSRVYDAFYNTNLVTGPWTPYNFNVPGAADGSSFFLTVTNDAAGRFYRTGVKVP